MKIVSWNVNGLRSVLNKGLVDFIDDIRPDVLCLQEIKLQQKHIEEFQKILKGYQGCLVTALRPGYSGVATFIRTELLQQQITHNAGIGIEKFDQEGRVLLTSINGYTIINTYIPSGTSGEERQQIKYEFLEDFNKFVSPLLNLQNPKLIVLGDFNICHKEIDIHHPHEAERRKLTGFLPEERAWLDRFTNQGFIDSFRHIHGDKTKCYSWWSYRANSRIKNLGWRIDYIFTSKDISPNINQADLLSSVMGSDHCPLLLELVI